MLALCLRLLVYINVWIGLSWSIGVDWLSGFWFVLFWFGYSCVFRFGLVNLFKRLDRLSMVWVCLVEFGLVRLSLVW